MDILKEIESYPIRLDIPVQWGDMDSANHVNNLRYMRWTESSRIEFFRKFNIGVAFQNGVAPILAWQDCKYIFPLTYPDIAIITCKVSSIGEGQFFMESKIYSDEHQRIAAVSSQRIMAYDYATLAKAKLPDEWIDGIERSMP